MNVAATMSFSFVYPPSILGLTAQELLAVYAPNGQISDQALQLIYEAVLKAITDFYSANSATKATVILDLIKVERCYDYFSLRFYMFTLHA
jgi:hypothetical protein